MALSTTVPIRTNADLTTKTIDGTGTFDIIMSSIYAHLKGEFEKGRITGDNYTKAYIELTNGALSAAVQFLLGKDQSYWQAVLIEQQAINADVQRELILEQIEVQRAQTLNDRTDGTPITGAVGKQKDLYTQQITSYQRDAEVKAAKMFVDAWITQKTLDEGLVAPSGFTNASLDTILSKLKTNNNLL